MARARILCAPFWYGRKSTSYDNLVLGWAAWAAPPRQSGRGGIHLSHCFITLGRCKHHCVFHGRHIRYQSGRSSLVIRGDKGVIT